MVSRKSVDVNMVAHPRESSYVRTDDWDEEAKNGTKKQIPLDILITT